MRVSYGVTVVSSKSMFDINYCFVVFSVVMLDHIIMTPNCLLMIMISVFDYDCVPERTQTIIWLCFYRDSNNDLDCSPKGTQTKRLSSNFFLSFFSPTCYSAFVFKNWTKEDLWVLKISWIFEAAIRPIIITDMVWVLYLNTQYQNACVMFGIWDDKTAMKTCNFVSSEC